MSYLPVDMTEAKDSVSSFFIELYVLQLRTGTSYIAACNEDIVFQGKTFIAIPIERDEISKSMSDLQEATTLRLGDVDDEKLAYIMNGFDFRGCRITIFKIQYPESLTSGVYMPFFVGYLDEPSFADGVFTVKAKSFFPAIKVPSRTYQLQCNSTFGDVNCGLNKDTKRVAVTAVSGNVIALSDSFQDNYWKNGTVIINGESRTITKSTGNLLHLSLSFIQRNVVGEVAKLERGCDKTKEDCNRFNNRGNFSGFPAIPFESQYR